MRHLTVGGGGLNVEERGPDRGPAIVFLNSLGTDLRIWDEVVARLPPGLRLVRMDKRGHGLSSVEPASRSIEAHAADLDGVIDRLGAGPALLVGVSIGGMIAQMQAANAPRSVRGLLLLDTAHRIGTAQSWNERIAAVRAGGMEAIVEGVTTRWFSEEFRVRRPDIVAAWRVLFSRLPVEGYVAGCESVRDADLTGQARRIGVRTRFVAGGIDLSTPPDLVREAAALVAGAGFEVVEGVGHLPPIERPDVVAAMVLAEAKEAGLV